MGMSSWTDVRIGYPLGDEDGGVCGKGKGVLKRVEVVLQFYWGDSW